MQRWYEMHWRHVCGAFTGPFGALLRWQLAHFNGKLPGRMHWFPAGTYAANMLACATIFAAQVRRQELHHMMSCTLSVGMCIGVLLHR